jgi:hypothetical protein
MIVSPVATATSLTFILAGQSLVSQAPFPHQEHPQVSTDATAVACSRTADPVHEIVFTYHNDELYQLVVTYDRRRMAGLTNDDVVDTLSARCGVPLVPNTRTARDGLSADIGPGMTLVAQWEAPRWLLTLHRSTYSAQYQLVLISKTLNPQSRPAITDAPRPNASDGSARQLDRRAPGMIACAVAQESLRG